MAAPMPVKEGLRLLRLVREMGRDNPAVLMHCDSQGAMIKIQDPMSSNPTKHIDVEHQFVRQCVLSAVSMVTAVTAADMETDSSTKPPPTDAINKCSSAVGLVDGKTDSARVGELTHRQDTLHSPRDAGVSVEMRAGTLSTGVKEDAPRTVAGRPSRGQLWTLPTLRRSRLVRRTGRHAEGN